MLLLVFLIPLCLTGTRSEQTNDTLLLDPQLIRANNDNDLVDLYR
jgi:hypothetical protein